MENESSPPYVRFETEAVEDVQASKEKGFYVSKDLDMIVIVPRGSAGKTSVREPYARWLKSVRNTPFRNELRSGDAHTPLSSARFPDAWIDKIEQAYAAWKKGQVLPEDGTPLAQWGVISPAERENLIRLHINTVEQLAEATEEALTNYGLGARRLRDRARDYLKVTRNDGAKLSAEMATLRQQNESLSAQVASLLNKLEILSANAAANSPVVHTTDRAS